MSGLRVFFVRGQFSVLPVSSGEKAGQVSTCPCLPRFACPWLLSFWASYHSLSTGELPLALTDALRLSPCVVYVDLPSTPAWGRCPQTPRCYHIVCVPTASVSWATSLWASGHSPLLLCSACPCCCSTAWDSVFVCCGGCFWGSSYCGHSYFVQSSKTKNLPTMRLSFLRGVYVVALAND